MVVVRVLVKLRVVEFYKALAEVCGIPDKVVEVFDFLKAVEFFLIPKAKDGSILVRLREINMAKHSVGILRYHCVNRPSPRQSGLWIAKGTAENQENGESINKPDFHL